MVRHGGMALPSVRGLGWSQRIARFVAAGLIVVLPTTHASRAETCTRCRFAPRPRVRRSSLRRRSPSAPAMPERVPASTSGATYTVQAGDSVYQIAQRLAGADRGQTVAVAEQILDLNLGARDDRWATVHERGVHRAGLGPGASGRRRRTSGGGRRPSRRNRRRCTSSNGARRCGRSPARSWVRRLDGPRSGSSTGARTWAMARCSSSPT